MESVAYRSVSAAAAATAMAVIIIEMIVAAPAGYFVTLSVVAAAVFLVGEANYVKGKVFIEK